MEGKHSPVFFDMEFTGLHQRTTPISIGVTNLAGDQFYAEFIDYDKSQVNSWIKENVISKLKFGMVEASPVWTKQGTISVEGVGNVSEYCFKGERKDVAGPLKEFILMNGSAIMVSDVLAYDWILFCELLGGTMKLPKEIYYIPIDISSMFYAYGVDPDVGREEFSKMQSHQKDKHCAIWDAMVIRECYLKLVNK